MHLLNNCIASCYDIMLSGGVWLVCLLKVLNLMNPVWAFNFAPLIKTKTKKPIFPSRPQRTGLYGGMLADPEPFQCSITHRSAGHVKMIETSLSM